MKNNKSIFFNKPNRLIHNILILNILIFLLANMAVSYSISQNLNPLNYIDNLGLNSNFYILIKKPWTLLTNMFTHVDFLHILFNMIYFWFFSKILQEKSNSQVVFSSYILGGLCGAIFYIIFYPLMSAESTNSILIGASGSVMSIMVASAMLNPNKNIRLLIIGSVKLKWIVLTLFILTSVINFHNNTGGKIDHIGGAFFGLIYSYFLIKKINIAWWFDSFTMWLRNFFRKDTNQKNVSYTFRGSIDRRDSFSREMSIKNVLSKKETEKEINKLLDKIKKVGYDNLSTKEKDVLKKLSEKY
jgi:membrane associated rhomboid family serine protease